jgi:assimilatory nitrate reductase catalytic subunit
MDQSLSAVAADCGVAVEDLLTFYDLFAAHERTVSLFSMGANQSAQGVAKGLSIINAHLATGRIGKPGACPFSITGQPNAMGGRETGGMANTLAGHMDFAPGRSRPRRPLLGRARHRPRAGPEGRRDVRGHRTGGSRRSG